MNKMERKKVFLLFKENRKQKHIWITLAGTQHRQFRTVLWCSYLERNALAYGVLILYIDVSRLNIFSITISYCF